MLSQKILLRFPNDSDSDVLFKWINNRELVIRNAPFREISVAEHVAWFANIRAKDDVVFFMIEDCETASVIGSCQLLNIHHSYRSAELQIRIGEAIFQNKGMGSEAVRQLTEYGFSELNLHRIALHVFANNLKAIHVYEKNGFIREGLFRQAARIDGLWLDVIYMAKVKEFDD